MSWLLVISTALGVVATALGLVNAFWSWMNKGVAATAKRLDDLEDCSGDHGRRIQSIEGEMKHLPNKEDVSELKLGMATMNGRMNTIDAEMGSISRTTRRIEDHLLKGDA